MDKENPATLPNVTPALWFHIILSSVAAAALLPIILIQRKQEFRQWSLMISGFAITVVLLVTGSGLLSRRTSSAHGALGYCMSLLVITWLVWDLYTTRTSRQYKKSVSQNNVFHAGRSRIGSFSAALTLVLMVAIGLIFGIALLFDWCRRSYTSQCFGHFGIGSWFSFYFSFCAAASFIDGKMTSNGIKAWYWTPDKLHSFFLLPCGFGLTFFGHGWNSPWDTEAFQHVFLGINALIGCALGLSLPNRNIFPGLVSSLAGYTFLTHSQDPAYPILGELHYGIGYLLVGLGLCLGIDNAFVAYQPANLNRNAFESPWQVMASILGVTAGLVIMTANSEEAALLGSLGSQGSVVFLGLCGVTMLLFAYLYAISKLITPETLEASNYAAIETEMD